AEYSANRARTGSADIFARPPLAWPHVAALHLHADRKRLARPAPGAPLGRAYQDQARKSPDRRPDSPLPLSAGFAWPPRTKRPPLPSFRLPWPPILCSRRPYIYRRTPRSSPLLLHIL